MSVQRANVLRLGMKIVAPIILRKIGGGKKSRKHLQAVFDLVDHAAESTSEENGDARFREVERGVSGLKAPFDCLSGGERRRLIEMAVEVARTDKEKLSYDESMKKALEVGIEALRVHGHQVMADEIAKHFWPSSDEE